MVRDTCEAPTHMGKEWKTWEMVGCDEARFCSGFHLAFEDAAICQLHSHSLQLVAITLCQDSAYISLVHDAAAFLLYAICRMQA